MADKFRDRIVETRKMTAKELADNSGNWRTHPGLQREAMTGVAREIGKAGSLLAYHSERNGGKITLIDGHLRKDLDPDETWTVNITDLNDAEADLLLLVYDPLSAMAVADKAKVDDLLKTVNADDLAVREMLRRFELQTAQTATQLALDTAAAEKAAETPGPDGMDLLPYEHYDYVLLLFRHELDWVAAVEELGLERRGDQRRTKKVGLARGIEGAKIINLIRTQRQTIEQLMARLGEKPAAVPLEERTGPDSLEAIGAAADADPLPAEAT